MTVPNELEHLKIDDVIVAQNVKYLIIEIHQNYFTVAWLEFPRQTIYPFDNPFQILDLKTKILIGKKHSDYNLAEWTFQSILQNMKKVQVTFESSASEYIL